MVMRAPNGLWGLRGNVGMFFNTLICALYVFCPVDFHNYGGSRGCDIMQVLWRYWNYGVPCLAYLSIRSDSDAACMENLHAQVSSDILREKDLMCFLFTQFVKRESQMADGSNMSPNRIHEQLDRNRMLHTPFGAVAPSQMRTGSDVRIHLILL